MPAADWRRKDEREMKAVMLKAPISCWQSGVFWLNGGFAQNGVQ
jgi:hypothetical protein